MSKRKPRPAPSPAVPPPVARLDAVLAGDFRLRWAVLAIAALVAGLYSSGLAYPLVFEDFAVLAPERLKSLVAPAGGASGALAHASLAATAKLAGADPLRWHRVLAALLHGGGALMLFLLARDLLGAVRARTGGTLSDSWIALFAASLFALHPMAVYAVAYLAQHATLLAGVASLCALCAFAYGVRKTKPPALVLSLVACAFAMAASGTAVALPVAMTALAWWMRPDAGRGRGATLAVLAIAFAMAAARLGLVASGTAPAVAESPAAPPGVLSAIGTGAWRVLEYFALALVPATPWMAIDMPETRSAAAFAWPDALAVTACAALALAAGLLARRRDRIGLAGLGALAALAMAAVELVPHLGAPIALARGYPWLAPTALVVPALLGALQARIAFAVLASMLVLWTGLAVERLGTFSSHVAIWDDAIRRAARAGATPADARLYLARAEVHRHAAHPLAAIEDYGTVLAREPDNRRALRGRAQSYLDAALYDEALRDFDRLATLEPREGSLQADRGAVLMQAGRHREALAAFDAALASGVQEPRVFLNRALARLRLEGYEGMNAVLDDIDRALARDPAYALAHYNRGLIFDEAARAGVRLRDAESIEIMRVIARQNVARACELGHRPACASAMPERDVGKPARGGPAVVSPEALRKQASPAK